MAANNLTSGKAKKSSTPRKAPKVSIPSVKKPNVMREKPSPDKKKNPQAPMFKKRLSK